MAAGGDWTLDDSTIAQLAADISINDMVTVAESYMKISPEKIKNLRDENRGSAEAVNREILRTWIYRFSGPHHRLVRMCRMFFVKLNSLFQLTDRVHKLLSLCAGICNKSIAFCCC